MRGPGCQGAMACALLLAISPTIDAGTCYLLDANAIDCAVCWKTTFAGAGIKGVREMMTQCPVGIVANWTNPLPNAMRASIKFDVGYSLQIDTTKFKFAHIRKVYTEK